MSEELEARVAEMLAEGPLLDGGAATIVGYVRRVLAAEIEAVADGTEPHVVNDNGTAYVKALRSCARLVRGEQP